MRKILTCLVLLAAAKSATAQQLQQVPLMEQGVATAYVSVPQGFQCNIKNPEEPSQICANSRGYAYHLQSYNGQQTVNPDQYFNQIIQTMNATPGVKITAQYPLSMLNATAQQRDSQLLHLQQQQVVTYAVDFEEAKSGTINSIAVEIHNASRRGASFAFSRIYGITAPGNDGVSAEQMHSELVRFAQSYRYDNQWAQWANNAQMQFEANLSNREQVFAATQAQIVRNNNQALDSSFESWKRRDAMTSAGQAATVAGINETQRMYDPSTGQVYEADGYYNYNYVNPNDPTMVYRTDNPNDNPNINNEMGWDFNQLEEYNGE